MKTKIITVITLFILSFSASAQIDRSIQPTPGPAPKIELGKATTFSLKNGLQVIVVENHKLPRASASLTIDNKPVFEGNKAGVSYLMGSLLGNGTKNISKDAFNERVDFLGAGVSFSSGGASAQSLKKYFPEILSLMADGVKNSIFSKTEFDKEVKVTYDNLKSNEKSVAAIARRVESALIYGKNNPYGEFMTKESVGNITLDDVKNNYNTYYRPNNAYLVIVGDVDTNTIKKQINTLFGDWKKGDLPVSTFPKPKNVDHTEIDFIDMPNAVQSEIVVANNIDLKLGDKDYYAAILANNILGGGGTARLFMNLREDKGYTYGSYSSISQGRYGGTFKATASVRNMVTDSSVVELLKEITKMRYLKVSEEELKNAKAAYIGSFVMNVQKPAVVAGFALNIARYKLPKDYYENYLANINAVTVDDVQNAAYNYFKRYNQRVIVTGKGMAVLKNLEDLKFQIHYYDTFGNPTTKPKMSAEIPSGLTAKMVVDSYFKAIGGKEKADAIKSIMTTANASIQGIEVVMITKQAAPNKSSMVLTGMGQVFQKVVFDGTKGYSEAQGKKVDLSAKQLEDAKKSTLFDDSKFANGTLDRVENVNGEDAYVIKSGNKSAFYSVKTGLKIKEVATTTVAGKTVETPTEYADYKEVNGIKMPFSIVMTNGPMKLDFKVKEIKINEGVSDKDFE